MIYLGFFGFFFAKILFSAYRYLMNPYQSSIIARMKTHVYPYVSFIIPTLNAADILPKCLTAIRSQHYPQSHIEIIIADGGSTDNTKIIAKKFKCKIVPNPKILHEPGKTLAASIAIGDIIFYTDSDNILSHKNWIREMIQPYCDNKNIMGFLPQTIPAPDSNSLDRYLGYICTDPLTWFMYGNATSGKDYGNQYIPIFTTKTYKVYKFPIKNPPLFGLSQGVGTNKLFKRKQMAFTDDLLSGIQMISEQGLIAYIPSAGVYHYHISGIINYIKKYSWRIRNNLNQTVKGMGLVNRKNYFPINRKIRMYLFIPYALTIIFPMIDALYLSIRNKDLVLLWHIPASFILALLIFKEYFYHFTRTTPKLGVYE
jgi:glycosyltransferase involved in cell wall biosynthesis